MKSRSLGESFSHALEGALYVWNTQRNVRIHAFLAYLALSLAFVLHLERLERLFVATSVAAVIVVELLNTAVEAAVDIHVTGYHPLARTAKNVAAGSVLVAAALSVVVGVEVFLPRLGALGGALRVLALERSGVFVLWALGALMLTVEVLRKSKGASK